MVYTPPPRSDVDLVVRAGYVAPTRSAVDMYLGETLSEVVGFCDLPLGITAEVVATVDVPLPVAVAYALGVIDLPLPINTDWILQAVDLDLRQMIQGTCIVDLPFWIDVVGSCELVMTMGWDIARVVDLDLVIPASVIGFCDLVMPICVSEIVGFCNIACIIEERTPVVGSCDLVIVTIKPGLDDAVAVPTAAVIDEYGTSWPLTSMVGLSLSRRLDQYAITATAEFAEVGDYLACALGRTVTISLAGREIVLRVSDRSRARQHVDRRYTVPLASPAYWLDAPQAGAVDGEFSGLMSAIAAAIAGSVSVSWRTVDGHIPASTMIAAGQSPLGLIRELAAAPGAVLQSAYDGSLIVQPEYPVPVSQWSTAAPELTIVEADVGIALEEREEYRGGINAVLVTNTTPAGLDTGGLRMESKQNDDGSLTWRVYSEPWDTSVIMRHTGGEWVQLQLVGDEIRTEVETVEIVDGEGRVNYPVLDVLGYAWKQAGLGLLTVSSDGTASSTTPGESLVEITYRTRCRVWLAINPYDEDVLFIAESVDKAGAGSVSVLCRRGDGDRQDETIVDTLITSEEVARERGRNHIDRNCSRRQDVPVTMPLTELYEMGIFALVIDVEGQVWYGMVVAQDVNWQAADDGAQDVTTTIEIEREAA